jgi:peptidoglycan/LPS O-acetylase OafA/YrhL
VTAAPGAGRTPTLDGLRGIAVLAVVIEHAWPDLLPGGYAGVDVFFVLSGFLITRMLITEVASRGTIDLVAFYARRVRRIIPAATLCVVVIAVVFTTILGIGFGPDFRTEALAAALSVSNFLFVNRATDYFATNPSSSPFLHYWSLAVEEQFYVVWPTLLLGIVALGRFAARQTVARGWGVDPERVRRWLPIGLAASIAIVSLALAIRGREINAFFLLPHRAWELLAGGLLAWLQIARPWNLGIARRPGLWLAALAGAAALAFTFVTEFRRWPGLGTTLPVLGTVLLVAGGTALPGARLLSMGWLRFFGRISYALYLWHWPTLAAASLLALPSPEPPPLMIIGAVGLAMLAAIFSTLVVEEPIRFSRTQWLARGRAIAAAGTVLAAASMTIMVSTSVALTARAAPDRPRPDSTGDSPASGAVQSTPPGAATAPPDIRPQLGTIKSDRERLIADRCYTTAGGRDLHVCVYGAAAGADGSPAHDVPAGMPVVALYGDSHAMHWFTAVNAWATQSGYALVSVTRSGCGAVDGDIVGDQEHVDGCNVWRVAALAHLAAVHPVLTVVSSSSGGGVRVDGVAVYPRTEPEAWIAPTERFIKRLTDIGGTIVYIGDVPRPGFDVPECLAAHWSDLAACAIPVVDAQPPGLLAAQVTATSNAGATLVDPTPWLCPNAICTWVLDGRIAYVDSHHITASVSLALAPRLAPYLNAAAGIPR